jgi:hypothetical protein
MITDNLAITGALKISLNNEVVHQGDNLVVTAGKSWVANRFKNTLGGFTIPGQMTHMAIGSSSTAAAVADTTLVTELSRLVLATAGGVVSGATVQYDCTWSAATAAFAIQEAGIFDAASAGTMLARTVFAVINKGTNDSVSISWTITIS